MVYGGDLGLVGDQPRDAHYLGVVAGVVAEGAGGEDDAGERRSLRVDEGFECGGFLVRESLAVLAPESLGAALLELRLSLALAADGAALTGLPPIFARVMLLVVAAGSLVLLAYWGAKSEIRTEENHRRILDLSEQLASTAETAQAAHSQAYRPVTERRIEEDYELIVKPMDDAVKRAWRLVTRFVAGAP